MFRAVFGCGRQSSKDGLLGRVLVSWAEGLSDPSVDLQLLVQHVEARTCMYVCM